MEFNIRDNNMTTTDHPNTSYTTMVPTTAPPDDVRMVEGFVACAVAVLFFGSNYLPVKKFDTGDGMFFQWVMCSAIWLTGLVTQCVQHFPTFYPLAMLGGFLWTTGNVFVVPIIQLIGLTQGLLIWTSCNLFTGWVTGRFGLFGLNEEKPSNTSLNYAGMGLCLVSAFIYAFIKTNVAEVDPEATANEQSPLLGDSAQSSNTSINTSEEENSGNNAFIHVITRLSPKLRRIIGVSLALIIGIMFGMNFAPVIYIQDNYVHNNVTASQNGLDYVFAHFTGIYATSTVYFLLYCAVMRNQPVASPRIILPGALAGLMWGIADIAFFIANADLSEAISFPIISSAPGIVGAIWGVVLFKEITGKRNIILLLCAFALAITGAILTGLSL